MSYKFKCPYCFNEVEHTEVLFRSKTFFAPEEFDCTGEGRTREDITMLYAGEYKPENKQILDEYDRREHFSLSEDPIYNSWWSNFGGTTEFPGNKCFAEYSRPIITPKKFGASEIIFDDDGFAVAVRDPWGVETKERVCPCCHNPLPLEYGKYPVKNICVIGITGVGKTVYLSQLLKDISFYLSNWGLNCIPAKEIERFVTNNKVSVSNPLPAATYPNHFDQPLIVNVSGTDKKTATLAFYSVAGENYFDPLCFLRYGRFVNNANGIILLIDPKEFISYAHMTDKIINQLNFTNTIDIPIAVCVSKSDKLKDILPEICFKNVKTEPNIFCSNDYNVISQALSELIAREYPILKEKLSNLIDTYNFFAISSLGKDCKVVSDDEYMMRLLSEPTPTRIEEPLGWLLKEFDLVKSDGNIFTPKKEAINERISELHEELIQLEVEKGNTGLFKRNKQKEYKSRISEIKEKIIRLEEEKKKYQQ